MSPHWLRLIQAGQFGSPAWHRALAALGTPEAVAAANADQLRGLGLTDTVINRLHAPDDARIARYVAWLDRAGHTLITLDDPRYPPLLRLIDDAPLGLWVIAADAGLCLSNPQLAIIGARQATTGGVANARRFAGYLARAGFTIVSGLAVGIDAAAHRGALESEGTTIAVLGCGIDQVYPPEHGDLVSAIAAAGAVVSEYPPGVGPQPHRFPARNRIISGLSAGVVVIEAASRSGALNTAGHAVRQGREVFALPGSIHNPLARGCHRLIRDGAKLVETGEHILEELAPLLQVAVPQPLEFAAGAAITPDPAYAALLEAMGYDPLPVAEIIERSTLTAAEVSSMLLLLEMQGQVEALPGGRYSRKA